MLENLNFDNLALRKLFIDETRENYVRSKVPRANFSRVWPTPVKNPQLVAYSLEALALLDIDENEMKRTDAAEYFAGNEIFPGSEPAAHTYCGHQFGAFSGQLGDGATMYLGEIVNSKGERWELQFKGAGKTPYSRSADGRKVLRSSIREFLMSEAMDALGIATTRAGTVVTSDTTVVRDIFYSGNPIYEKATIITRIAPTFLRFGSFEIFKDVDEVTGRAGPSVGLEDEMLPVMLEYALHTFYPHIADKYPAPAHSPKERYLAMYSEIVQRTARLCAEWQCVGFCHGVLNTDNMSIIGLTIDYGPFGMMEYFDPNHICNGSDDQGRYSYKNQPAICKWNCSKLAEAIGPCLPLEESLAVLESSYDSAYETAYMNKMRKKVGLLKKNLADDTDLIAKLFQVLEQTRADMTNCIRALSRISIPLSGAHLENELKDVVEYLLTQVPSLQELQAMRKRRSTPSQLQMLLSLAAKEPQLLRQLGIDEGYVRDEMAKMEAANAVASLTQLQKDHSDRAAWTDFLTSYRQRLLKEVEGLGEDEIIEANAERVRTMNASNPRVILRNYIAQDVIGRAEQGDFQGVRDVLRILRSPYEELELQGEALGKLEESKPCRGGQLVVT